MNMGISQERKRLLNIVSQKLISYDFCTSFVLHKVKKTFRGSKWKLLELTHVSRYLAYVTCPHDWRIRVCCGQLKNLMEGKNKLLQHTKKLSCREKLMLLCNIRHGMCRKEADLMVQRVESL